MANLRVGTNPVSGHTSEMHSWQSLRPRPRHDDNLSYMESIFSLSGNNGNTPAMRYEHIMQQYYELDMDREYHQARESSLKLLY